MTTCTAHEFLESSRRKGSMRQFGTAASAAGYGLKADIAASVIPDRLLAKEYATMAATLAFIAFPDLRA